MSKAKKEKQLVSLADFIKEELQNEGFEHAWKEVKEEELIANEIKKARLAAGLTQKQLAVLLDTTQSFISDLENAEYTGYSLPTLKKVAKALKLKLIIKFEPMAS